MNMFKPTSAKTPKEYIDLIVGPKKSDIKDLDQFIQKIVPSLKPFIISGMIGYGKYHYRSVSGQEGDWATVLLASQKNYISIYICPTNGDGYLPERYKKDLGKVSLGRSCIRFKKLEDLDLVTFKKILQEAENLATIQWL